MWKKKKDKQEVATEEVKEANLLQTLCGNESELYNFASGHLCVNPMTAISTKSLEVLMDEAEKTGDYRPALDTKTITTTEKEKAEVEKQGLTDRAAFLQKRIESQKLIQNRTADIMNIATRYYQERLLELGEDAKRAERIAERKETEGVELRAEQEKQAQREARKREMKGMPNDRTGWRSRRRKQDGGPEKRNIAKLRYRKNKSKTGKTGSGKPGKRT